MSKKETIKFEGKDYHFVAKKWDVRKSLRIKQKLAPIMLTGFDAFQKVTAGGGENINAIADLFDQKMFEDEDAMWNLIVQVLEKDVIFVDENGEQTRVDATFINTHFSDDIYEMYMLVYKVGEFQLGSFFRKVLGGMKD